MITADKILVGGQYWIKVQFKHNIALFNKMMTVKGARFNAATDLWSVPYSNRDSFEHIMSEHLIVWLNDEDTHPGGICEDNIPDQPIIEGYSVQYDKDKNIVDSTGFKTSPWGEFQVKGFNVLVTRPFLILADDAGLGKSWQVATAMEARKKLGQINRGVIMCKASLLYNWRDEIHMHTNCKAIVVAGTRKQRANVYEELRNTDDWTFLIISYETYRVDCNNIQWLDTKKPLDFCVVDEAHKIKNSQSRIGDVLHYVPYKLRYVLTATPLPNTPLESFNYLKWGGKCELNWWDFKNRYAIWGGRNNKEILMYQRIDELREAIQKHMLRRLKKDKLEELPDIVFRTINLPMSSKQKTLYNAVKKEIMEDLKDTSLTKIPSALSKLLRLQQVTDSPAIIGAEEVESSKLEALDELLEELIENGGQKVIVFSRFRTMTEILRKRYEEYNPAVIHGDIDANGKTENSALRAIVQRIGKAAWLALPEVEKRALMAKEMTSERQMEVYKFQKDTSCKLFLGCAPACREGLTLTAATHVVFLDCEWSPAYVEQAFSRAHRIGQKNAVTVHYLVCEGTIDAYVQAVLKRKEAMAQTMLDEGVGAIGRERARDLIAELIGERVPKIA